MAQSGYTPILIYASSTASAAPTAGNLTSSANGAELALNYTDGKLYYKDNVGAVQVIGVKLPSSTLPVANGGTGATTLTANNVILGNGTSAVQFVAPGSNGNVLTSNGTTWVSAAVAASLLGQTDSASPFETALGYQAGNANTGVNNTFIGYQAGLVNSTGTDNVAIGFKALDANTTGIRNIAIGTDALGANNSGQENIAIGRIALGNNTSGFGNVAVGSAALSSNVSGGSNTAVGYGTLNSNTGSNNTAVGSNALFLNTANNNTAVGYGALDANTTGTENTSLGTNSLGANNSGINNTAVGYSALQSSSSASENTAVGWNALRANSTGASNTAVGSGALYSNTGASQSVAVGTGAMFSSTGANNVGVGHTALYQCSGSNNTAIGLQAGYSLTTGTNNIIIGTNAEASSASASYEATIGSTSITSTRLRGMVQLNAAMLEQATVSATAATGTINFDARTQSVLYYTSNASANWTLNVRGASGVSLNSVMSTGQSLTIAFLVTNGATAYYQSGFQVDSVSVTPKWQGGTAPTSGNASSIDAYVITIIKTGSATFTALASQTKFA